MQTHDEVTLVDRNDVIVGRMDKKQAHRKPAKLHRASSVLLFSKKKMSSPKKGETSASAPEIVLQKRSEFKITGAGHWATTVCGNVLPGESYEACATRRLAEELGITGVQLELGPKFHYQASEPGEYEENEIDQVFLGWYDGEIAPNPAEVQETAWVSVAAWLDAAGGESGENVGDWTAIFTSVDDATAAFWMESLLNNPQVQQAVREFLQ